MAGPWEKYADTAPSGPWDNYASPAKTQADFMAEQGDTGKRYPMAKHGEPLASNIADYVPQWGRDNPNLYGMYGAGKAIAQEALPLIGAGAGSLSGLGMASIPLAGAGYALGKDLNSMLGIEGETGRSLPLSEKIVNFAKGSAGQAVGMGAGAAGGSILKRLPGGDVAEALFTKAPVGRDMLAKARNIATGTKPVSSETDKIIDVAVNRLRPTVSGKKASYEQQSLVKENNREAFKNIVRTSNETGGYQFTEDGINYVSKALPESLDELAQAIPQAKKHVWSKVEQALGEGSDAAIIDTTPLAQALKAGAGSKTLKIRSPSSSKAMESWAKRLEDGGSLTPQEAETLIQDLNIDLKPHFRDGTFPNTIEYKVSKYLRNMLDDTIDKVPGAGFQELKNSYGALKSIENDVLHRNIVNKRANPKGIFDMTDVMTNGEILAGIASGNPVMVAKGVTGKVTKNWIQRINNVDNTIKSTFKKIAGRVGNAPPVTPSGYLPEGPATVEMPPEVAYSRANPGGFVNTLKPSPTPPPTNPLAGKVNTLRNMTPEQPSQDVYVHQLFGKAEGHKDALEAVLQGKWDRGWFKKNDVWNSNPDTPIVVTKTKPNDAAMNELEISHRGPMPSDAIVYRNAHAFREGRGVPLSDIKGKPVNEVVKILDSAKPQKVKP